MKPQLRCTLVLFVHYSTIKNSNNLLNNKTNKP